MKSAASLTLLVFAGTASGIGQTLSGQPVGQQVEKDHLHEALVAKIDPKTGKVHENEHITDYDAFIKNQAAPHGAHSNTPASAPAPASSTVQSHQSAMPTTVNQPIAPLHTEVPVHVEEAHHPNHPDGHLHTAPASMEGNVPDMTAFDERRREKTEKLQSQIQHQMALDKYQAKLDAEHKIAQGLTPSANIVPTPTHKTMPVSPRNAVPFIGRNQVDDEDGESHLAGHKSRQSAINISTTQAIFIGALFCFLLLIALVIFLVSWLCHMMVRMKEQNEDFHEFVRQNSLQKVNQNQPDLEGQPDKGNEPKLLKGRNAQKKEAYGRFEDEIQISREDFPEVGADKPATADSVDKRII